MPTLASGIVYLADDGEALFRTTVSAPVRALTSHPLSRPRGPAAVVAGATGLSAMLLLLSQTLVTIHAVLSQG